jgi:hypothetical protein
MAHSNVASEVSNVIILEYRTNHTHGFLRSELRTLRLTCGFLVENFFIRSTDASLTDGTNAGLVFTGTRNNTGTFLTTKKNKNIRKKLKIKNCLHAVLTKNHLRKI